MYWHGKQREIFCQILMLHRSVMRYCCFLAAYLWKRKSLFYEKENHYSHVTRPYHNECWFSVFYMMFVCMLQFNFRRSIGIRCFETQFVFALYIDSYKMVLYFSPVIIYKAVKKPQNYIIREIRLSCILQSSTKLSIVDFSF